MERVEEPQHPVKAPSSSSAPRAQAEPRSQPAHTAALGRGLKGKRGCERVKKSQFLISFLEEGNINDSYVPAVPHCGKCLPVFKLFFLFPQPMGCFPVLS